MVQEKRRGHYSWGGLLPHEGVMTLFVQDSCLSTVHLSIREVVGFLDRIINFLLLCYGLCRDDLR